MTSNKERDNPMAKGGVTTPFPWKLHIMLDEMSKDEAANSIVGWQPHGKAFVVYKPKEFVAEVMPHFFNQTKYASFQRQLNLYGFSRFTHGPDKGSYYHRCFIKGKTHLCKGMIRQKIKGTKVRKSFSPEDEPNFYSDDHKQQRDPEFEQLLLSGNESLQQQPAKNHQLMQQLVSDDMSGSGLNRKISKFVSENKARTNSTSTDSIASTRSVVSSTSASTIAVFTPQRIKMSESKTSPRSSSFLQHDGTTGTIIPNTPQVVLPRSSVAASAISSVDLSIPPTLADKTAKGGDLLFFEGQPFRYLEHFEELPCSHQSQKTQKQTPTTKTKIESTNSMHSTDKTTEVTPHPSAISCSSTQMIHNAKTTNKSQDMINNIMHNIDSSSSSSLSFQRTFSNKRNVQNNTFCTA